MESVVTNDGAEDRRAFERTSFSAVNDRTVFIPNDDNIAESDIKEEIDRRMM